MLTFLIEPFPTGVAMLSPPHNNAFACIANALPSFPSLSWSRQITHFLRVRFYIFLFSRLFSWGLSCHRILQFTWSTVTVVYSTDILWMWTVMGCLNDQASNNFERKSSNSELETCMSRFPNACLVAVDCKWFRFLLVVTVIILCKDCDKEDGTWISKRSLIKKFDGNEE